jgi:hypothetical protein
MKSITAFLMTALVAGSVFASDAAPKAAKPDLAKGEASFAVCASCHGADGNSGTPAYPKLAQQHPEYLVSNFRNSNPANAPMPS